MKISQTIFIATIALVVCQQANAGEYAPACLELRDQFDTPQKLSFPTTNVTLLTIADKKGSEQIAGWITPLKQRFGSRIDIRGIADVSSVPGPFRGMVRKKFQKLQTYPVMMDWSGAAVKAYTYAPEKANILVLNRDGDILGRFSGMANGPNIAAACAAVEKALSDTPQIASDHKPTVP